MDAPRPHGRLTKDARDQRGKAEPARNQRDRRHANCIHLRHARDVRGACGPTQDALAERLPCGTENAMQSKGSDAY